MKEEDLTTHSQFQSNGAGPTGRATDLVDSAEAFTQVLEWLQGVPIIALDTEADGMHSYREKMCLLQISDGQRHCLVDPLAGFDLAPLFQLLEKKEFILHDCDFDLSIIQRTYAPFQPEHIFDTMLAARFCGYTNFGLAAMVKSLFDADLEKESQRCDWSQRPLSETMRHYAVCDVVYLHEMRRRLSEKLEEMGRMDWYRQTLERNVTDILNRPQATSEASFWRLNKKPRFKGRSLAVLRAVWEWREELAQQWDRPPFKVVRGHEVVQIAEDSLGGRKLRVSGRAQKHIKDLQDYLRKARELPEQELPQRSAPRRSRPAPEEEDLFTALKKHRNRVAEETGVEPGLLCPNTKLLVLARDPGSVEEELLPWQKEVLGITTPDDVKGFEAAAGAGSSREEE